MNELDSILKTFDLNTIDVVMIVVCSGLFLAFWTLMETLVFRPYMKFYELRESRTTGAKGALDDKAREVESLTQEYQRRLTDARVAAMTDKISAIGQAKKQSAASIEKAESEARRDIEAARSETKREVGQLRDKAMSDATAMADAVVEKIKSQPRASV